MKSVNISKAEIRNRQELCLRETLRLLDGKISAMARKGLSLVGDRLVADRAAIARRLKKLEAQGQRPQGAKKPQYDWDQIRANRPRMEAKTSLKEALASYKR